MKKLSFIFLLLVSILLSQSYKIPAPAAWKTLETQGVPAARHENAFVEADSLFYLLGGRGIKPVNIFDPATNTWSEGMPPPIELHHFQAVSSGSVVYIVCAMTGKFPNETPIANIMEYHTKDDKWVIGAEIPADRQRGSAGVVLLQKKIYVLGGIKDGHNGDHKKWFDVFDMETKIWQQLPDLPRERDHFQAVFYRERIYVAGGRLSSNSIGKVFELTVPEIDVFDFNTQKWQTLANSIPTQRAGASTVIYHDKIVVIGGESMLQESAHGNVEALDPISGGWKSLPNLNTGRHGTQSIVYNDKIYITAGSGNRGGSPELNSIECFE